MGALICLKWRRIGREVWSQSQWALCPVLKESEGRDSRSYSLSTCCVAHRWRGSIRGQDWSLPLLETDGLEGPRTEQRKKPCAVKGLTVECESGRREP